jgi:serine/threonine protein phosphatase PrpC
MMQPGDLLMACSDGLWHYFSPEELASVLYAEPPREAVEILVGEARRRARGTGDNISIAVLKLEALPTEA